MAKELKDYTNGELFNELYRRIGTDPDLFSVSMWVREDVEEVFPNKTEEEVTRFMEENRKYFDNHMTELGYETIGYLDY